MKMVLFAALFISSVVAQAELKQKGQFVPSLCSAGTANSGNSDTLEIKRVCIGGLAGTDKAAIHVELSNGNQDVYAIDIKKKVIRMGANTQSFKGESVSVWDAMVRGEIITVMGIRRSVSIKLETSENLKFQDNLEYVYTTL